MVSNATIEAARLRDVGILNKLFIQSVESSFDYFTEAYREQLRREHSKARFLKALCSDRSCFLIARLEGNPVGYSLSRVDGVETGFIHWMYVLPSMQGKGIGSALLGSSQKILSERGVHSLRLLTHDQVEFYRRLGFKQQGYIEDYSGGVPMTVMECQI
jgi:ribosomal protein S18 acetylase RimI-like enzyme